ncbi:MAG TPA: DUF3800 domain-containing protein, partial [Terriglobales bacterium]|nr:DUF3800 domain-containing protein [Terriglobales bacterium]
FDVLGLTGLFMESIVPGTPAEYPGIQAADLVCYEVGKFFNYSLPRKKKPRWAYKQVSSLPNSFLHFGKKELRSLLDTPNITAEGIAYSVL